MANTENNRDARGLMCSIRPSSRYNPYTRFTTAAEAVAHHERKKRFLNSKEGKELQKRMRDTRVSFEERSKLIMIEIDKEVKDDAVALNPDEQNHGTTTTRRPPSPKICNPFMRFTTGDQAAAHHERMMKFLHSKEGKELRKRIRGDAGVPLEEKSQRINIEADKILLERARETDSSY